jgi:hypothetical protein
MMMYIARRIMLMYGIMQQANQQPVGELLKPCGKVPKDLMLMYTRRMYGVARM